MNRPHLALSALIAGALTLAAAPASFAQGTAYACESGRLFHTINLATGAKTQIGFITSNVTVPATLAPGTLLHFQIHGIAKAKDGDTAMSAAAQTLGALHKALPNLPHPPAALDGTIALGVLPPESKAGGK